MLRGAESHESLLNSIACVQEWKVRQKIKVSIFWYIDLYRTNFAYFFVRSFWLFDIIYVLYCPWPCKSFLGKMHFFFIYFFSYISFSSDKPLFLKKDAIYKFIAIEINSLNLHYSIKYFHFKFNLKKEP